MLNFAVVVAFFLVNFESHFFALRFSLGILTGSSFCGVKKTTVAKLRYFIAVLFTVKIFELPTV